jgi:hypothetical protein
VIYLDKQKAILQQSTEIEDASHYPALQCSLCSCLNEPDARFCEQCGTFLKDILKCPHCGASARPNADICEVCGEWLLKGQCMFCYALIDEDAVHCGNCGNPTAGIACPQCGNLSCFDFCKTCNLPLTISAREMIQECTNDPEMQELARLCTNMSSVTKGNASHETHPEMRETEQFTASSHDEISQLKAYREINKQKQTIFPSQQNTRALFSNAQKEGISLLGTEIAKEKERRRVEEERRRQEEEERKRKLEEQLRNEKQKQQAQFDQLMKNMKSKRFSSHQEARKYFMSIAASLPEDLLSRVPSPGLRWRCNAYDNVHDGPYECGDPSQGGEWLLL